MKPNIIILKHPSGKTAHLKLGFSWPAFLLGPLWALVKRMWLYAIVLVVALLPISFLDGYAEHTKNMPLTIFVLGLYIAYMVVCGKYGNSWLQSSLLKRGYRPESATDGGA